MAKMSSTLPAMLVVLWLAMSVGTWAEDNNDESWTDWASKGLGLKQDNAESTNIGGKQKPNEQQIMGEWVNVLKGAEMALEADKRYTASAMIAGVVAQLRADNSLSNKEKAAKFEESVQAIQNAVEADNTAKAVTLIKGLAANFRKVHGFEQGGGGQQKQRGVKYLENADKEKKLDMLGTDLRQVFEAIKQDQKDKALQILASISLFLENNKDLIGEENAFFIRSIKETEKYIKEDDKQKAERTLKRAVVVVGLHLLGEEEEKAPTLKVNPQALAKVDEKLQEAFQAIEEHEENKAKQMLQAAVEELKRDKSLCPEEKFKKLMEFIVEAEKLLQSDARDKAGKVIQGAQMAIGLSALKEKAKGARKAGASGSEL